MYLTISLRSNTLLETGERTGSSGTSLQTKNFRKKVQNVNRGGLLEKEKGKREQLTRADERHFHSCMHVAVSFAGHIPIS